jgi:hemolysin III
VERLSTWAAERKEVDVHIVNAEENRQQSGAEEIANSISHGIGLIAAFVGAPILIVDAARNENGLFVVGASVFSATMIMLYFASSVYHALPPGKAKRVFRIIEHSVIFLLIAGTYTPFTLGVLHGPWGWSLFGVVWGIALLGISLKLFYLASRPALFTSLYLMMGWVAVIVIYPFWVRMHPAGFVLFLAGGLFYTVGVAFFVADSRLKYGHLVWHFFVMAGTLCHYFAVLWYAA